jgi:hypothetical protein
MEYERSPRFRELLAEKGLMLRIHIVDLHLTSPDYLRLTLHHFHFPELHLHCTWFPSHLEAFELKVVKTWSSHKIKHLALIMSSNLCSFFNFLAAKLVFSPLCFTLPHFPSESLHFTQLKCFSTWSGERLKWWKVMCTHWQSAPHVPCNQAGHALASKLHLLNYSTVSTLSLIQFYNFTSFLLKVTSKFTLVIQQKYWLPNFGLLGTNNL